MLLNHTTLSRLTSLEMKRRQRANVLGQVILFEDTHIASGLFWKIGTALRICGPGLTQSANVNFRSLPYLHVKSALIEGKVLAFKMLISLCPFRESKLLAGLPNGTDTLRSVICYATGAVYLRLPWMPANAIVHKALAYRPFRFKRFIGSDGVPTQVPPCLFTNR